LNISVQGNPLDFDLEEGLSATDFLGNDIPFGNFFYYTVQDSTGKFISDVDYYKLGDYTVTYYAQNSGLTSSVVRIISVIIPPFDTNWTDELRLRHPMRDYHSLKTVLERYQLQHIPMAIQQTFLILYQVQDLQCVI